MVIGLLGQKDLRKLHGDVVVALQALVVTQRIVFESYIVENSLIRREYR